MDLDDDELRCTRVDNGTASKEELLEEIETLRSILKMTKKRVRDLADLNQAKETEKDQIYEAYKSVNTIVNKEELHRLAKALKTGNENKVKSWAECLGIQINDRLTKYYNARMVDIENIYKIAVAYTLHFNGKCNFGARRIQDFLDDFFITLDLLKNEEYAIQDYLDQLKADHIEVCSTQERGQ